MQARHLTVQKKEPRRHPGKAEGEEYRFSVLFIESAGWWSAQILEHDIATQAKTLQELLYEVERILVAHIALAAEEGRQPFQGIPRAPEKYWERFKKSHISMRSPSFGFKLRGSSLPRIRKTIRIAESTAA
jgi:predicted RNase H-like HicB family nuclease